jgi:hypothetical protein
VSTALGAWLLRKLRKSEILSLNGPALTGIDVDRQREKRERHVGHVDSAIDRIQVNAVGAAHVELVSHAGRIRLAGAKGLRTKSAQATIAAWSISGGGSNSYPS